jgi:hypothetical protein
MTAHAVHGLSRPTFAIEWQRCPLLGLNWRQRPRHLRKYPHFRLAVTATRSSPTTESDKFCIFSWHNRNRVVKLKAQYFKDA